MKFKISHASPTPLYKQVILCVKNAIRSGELKNGDFLPSLNEFAARYGVSMETAKKAYSILKKECLVSGKQGKGFFIDVRKSDAPKKILFIPDKLSAFKLEINAGLAEALDHPADFTIHPHYQDLFLLEKLVNDSFEEYTEYDYYIIVPHFPKSVKPGNVAKILRRIPNEKLIILDIDIPEVKGNIGRVYQDFSTDGATALKSGIERIRKYNRAMLISSDSSLYGEIICPGIEKVMKDNGIQCETVHCFRPEMLQPGTLFIVLRGQLGTEHFSIIREAMSKGYTFGKEIGLVSYNDEPVNEFLCGGIACMSSDFAQMGRTVAEMINVGHLCSVHNPFNLIPRASL